MSYSFVRLYLSKYDVCVLNHIWINPKRFLIILYVFESDFYHSLCLCLVFTLFSLFNIFCFEKQVSKFLATHFGYLRELPASYQFWLLVLATCKPRVQAASSHRRVSGLTRDLPVVKCLESAF